VVPIAVVIGAYANYDPNEDGEKWIIDLKAKLDV
jgi:hypothetical protein